MNKSNWLEWAEVIDALRSFPRLRLRAVFGSVRWYARRELPTVPGLDDRHASPGAPHRPGRIAQNIVGGVIGITIPFVGQMFTKIADVYMNSGRKWDGSR